MALAAKETAKLGPGHAALDFTLDLIGLEGQRYFHSPLIKISGARTVYAVPEQRAVKQVGIDFYTNGTVDVEAIEIIGPPPSNIALLPVTPPEDADLTIEANAKAEADAAESERSRQAGRSQLEAMRALRATIDLTTERWLRARKWMQLNTAAEHLAEILAGDESQKSLAEASGVLGVTINWCEPSASWAAGTKGYEQYLELWPRGPQADEAWWRGRVESACGDSEGTADEYRTAIAEYSGFLKRFPRSKHAPEARAALNESKQGLKRQLKVERE